MGEIRSKNPATEISIPDRGSRIQQLLQDTSLEVKGVELLQNLEDPNSDMILINYEEKNEFVEECPFGKVVLACFTTAHARLHLYETLEKLGERVLYFDTDSIIYQHEEGEFNPTIVNSLGGWTDELDGCHIIKFMSGAQRIMLLKQTAETLYMKSRASLLIIAPLKSSP